MSNFKSQVINLVRQHYKDIGDPINDLSDEQVKKLSLYTNYGLRLAWRNLVTEFLIWQKILKGSGLNVKNI